MAFVGGPSGQPVMLIAPPIACAIHSKLLYSSYGPPPVAPGPPMAFVGGPSGQPVMLIAPPIACAIHSKLLYSSYGPPLPKPFTEAAMMRGFSLRGASQPSPTRS